jgi:phosphoglycerate dehydrogenase-like enzyme
MAKVLIIGAFHEDGMKLFEARPEVSIEIVDGSDQAELMEKIEDADAVTIRTALLPARVIERARRLKVVSRHGVGYDNIDVDALTTRKIPLAIAPTRTPPRSPSIRSTSCWRSPSRVSATTARPGKADGRCATAWTRSTF